MGARNLDRALLVGRNLGCRKQKITNARVRKGFALVYYTGNGMCVLFQVSHIQYFISPCLTLFPSVWATLSGRFLCHDKDATRRCRLIF